MSRELQGENRDHSEQPSVARSKASSDHSHEGGADRHGHHKHGHHGAGHHNREHSADHSPSNTPAHARVVSVEPGAEPEGVLPHMTTALAGAKLLAGLHHLTFRTVTIEENSVYGAAILMPQIARTMGYPSFLVAQAIESYVYLVFCLFLHGAILVFIAKEEEVMDGFAGEMYLCDYGVNLDACPDAPGCIGPGGTNYTMFTEYSNFGVWATRRFAVDALKAVLPHRSEEILAAADPGEFGGESNSLRYLCCFIFVVSIVSEFHNTAEMVRLLYYLPTQNEPWVELKLDAAQTRDVSCWLDEVRVHVKGMSWGWKLVNLVCVALPKICLFILTSFFGVTYLMETPTINDLIVNVMALGFLLAFDETICDNLMSTQANYLVENVEPYRMDSLMEEEEMSEVAAVKRHSHLSLCTAVHQVVYYKLRNFWLALALTTLFIRLYYETHCDMVEGRWISKVVYVPKGMSFSVFNALFHEVESQETPAWTPPS